MKANAKPASAKKARLSRALVAGLVSGLLIVMGIFGYRYQQQTHDYPLMVSSAVHLSNFLAELRPAKQQLSLPKTKKTANNQTTPTIHFEFYTALPAMQVNVPSTPTVTPVLKAIPTLSKNTLPLPRTKVVARRRAIISPEELEKEWSEEIKRHK